MGFEPPWVLAVLGCAIVSVILTPSGRLRLRLLSRPRRERYGAPNRDARNRTTGERTWERRPLAPFPLPGALALGSGLQRPVAAAVEEQRRDVRRDVQGLHLADEDHVVAGVVAR